MLSLSRPRVLVATLLLAVLVGCGSDATTGAGSTGTTGVVGAGGDLTWGDGTYAVVLAHGAAFDAASWQDQAEAIAEQGATVVAVEDIGTEHLAEVVGDLQADGHPAVALVGASAGADALLSLSSQEPDLADQVVTLSANQVVEGLGTQPKLFVASQDEPGVAVSTELADTAPGEDNVALVVPGSAHAQNIFDTDQGPRVLQAVLERLAQ